MLIEIHMIQNHSPSNLNRDDLGAPKTCVFGGVTRARISSQCLKRSIRNPGNPDDEHNREPGMFAKSMEGHIGLLTKFLPWLVEKGLQKLKVDENEIRGVGIKLQSIAKSEEKLGAGKKKRRLDPRRQTPQLIRIHPGLAGELAERLVSLRESDEDSFRYFLNPAVSFRQLVEAELEDSQFNENQRKSILDKAWLILNCRMEELESDAEQPEAVAQQSTYALDAESAKIIVTTLESLPDDKFKNIIRKQTDPEKKQLKDDAPKPPPGYKDAEKKLWADLQHNCADIALFGRMTTSEFFEDVKAALQVAHAISTHAAVNEVDYFTAVDDRARAGGRAGHVDEAMYNSACFYKYFSLDWDQLVYNLAPEPKKPEDKKDDSQEIKNWEEEHKNWADKLKPNAVKLAACTLGHFLRAAARTTPSGKQNSFASHCEPCGILVEIKKNGKIPTSYANAFADPAGKIGDPPDDNADCESLVGRSIAQFGDHVYNVRNAYGIESTLFWHALPLYRYPLQGWEREADGRKAKVRDENGEETKKDKPAVQFATKCLRGLGGEDGKPEGLVEAVIEALDLGFKWADVKDPGESAAKES